MKKTHNHTIMDGRVVHFAEDFKDEGKGVFGNMYEAVGPYDVSASRNMVVVHRAEFSEISELSAFKVALNFAFVEHVKLAQCNGRPKDDNNREPIEVEVVSGDLPHWWLHDNA